MLSGLLRMFGGGPRPRLGQLYRLEVAPELTVHLLPVELGKRGRFASACVAYVCGPEKSAAELCRELRISDLCLPPLILPQALFLDGSCAPVETAHGIAPKLFQRHVFYDPAQGARYSIHGEKYQYLGPFCSLLQVTQLETLQAAVLGARQQMLSNFIPGMAESGSSAANPMELPADNFINQQRMWVLAKIPNSLEVMDDPEMDMSTIEDALLAEIEAQGIGEFDGNGYCAECIELFTIANPGAYPQLLRTVRGVLMAIGVKAFQIEVSILDTDD